MAQADRYLRSGGLVPQVYPGTLASLSTAIRDTREASMLFPGEHMLDAVSGRVRFTVQVWEAGVRTWWPAGETAGE